MWCWLKADFSCRKNRQGHSQRAKTFPLLQGKMERLCLSMCTSLLHSFQKSIMSAGCHYTVGNQYKSDVRHLLRLWCVKQVDTCLPIRPWKAVRFEKLTKKVSKCEMAVLLILINLFLVVKLYWFNNTNIFTVSRLPFGVGRLYMRVSKWWQTYFLGGELSL